MKFRIGDDVVVITGSDKGKTGSITRILESENKVIVEGINMKTKHVKGRDGVPGEKVQFAAPIQASNLAVIDAKTKKPSRIGYLIDKNGNKTRITKASGQEVVKAAKKEKTKEDKGPKTIKA